MDGKIHEHRGTITSATNTGIEHLSAYIGLRADRLPEVDLSCLKVWTVGAEMISAESCRILQEQLAPMGLAPHLLMPGYGLTETTLVATCHPRNTPVKTFTLDRRLMVSEQVVRYVPKGEDAAEFTSVGKPVQYCEVRIADKDGKPLPADRVGVVETGGQRHLRLFRQSRSDRVLVQRGVVLHRRHGLHGRRGRPVHRWPFQGNHHRARAELLPRRHRAHRPVRHGKGVPARGSVRRVRSPGRPRDHPDVLHPGEKGR
ncbi:MAG: AMP-binding protein [Bilophila wadsworthia]